MKNFLLQDFDCRKLSSQDQMARHELVQLRDQLINERNNMDELISEVNGWLASNNMETQILMLRSSGHSYRDISQKLGVSNTTVYNYVKKLKAEGKILDSKSEEVDFGDC